MKAGTKVHEISLLLYIGIEMNLPFEKFQSSQSHSNLEKYSKLPAQRELWLCLPRVLSCYVPDIKNRH